MSSRFVVYVKTGDQRGAGTDANVTISLHDSDGAKSEAADLDNFLRNDFERGQTDKFSLSKSKTNAIGPVIAKVEFWRDSSGIGSDWYLELITVENMTTGKTFEFPVLRWIESDFHYVITHLDTSLPQFDEQKAMRIKELSKKRKVYEYCQKATGMPSQVGFFYI